MANDVIVPEVGEVGMDVTFVRWLKEPGEAVAVGEPLFEVDTEKSVMVVEAYAAGTLADLRVSEGDIVAPRDVIGRILAADESPDDDPGSHPTTDAPSPLASEHVPGSVDSSSALSGIRSGPSAGMGAAQIPPRRGGASPRARRLAGDLGVVLDSIAGSGPDGLITEADVRAAAERRPIGGGPAAVTATAVEPGDPRARARRAIAELTTSSWQTIPHFYLQLAADVDRALEVARPTALICSAVAQALVRHPECNLGWVGDHPEPRDGVDLGLLVDAPAGLLITVITDAHDLDLAAMADAIRAAADRARSGTLAAADFGPRSLTISNLGMYAVDRFTAVIPRPDILTLTVGRSRVAARWDGSVFAPRREIDLTLSVDHRALDGAVAARFMTTLETILADPIAAGLA